MKNRVLGSIFALVLGASAAHAATTDYDSLDSFNTAVGFTTTVDEDFSDDALNPLIDTLAGSFLVNGGRLQRIANGAENFTTIFFTRPLNAIAFRVGGLSGDEQARVEIDDEVVADLSPTGSQFFFGLISTKSFSSISFFDTAVDLNTQFNIDDLRMIPAVPLPAGMPLLLAAIGAFALLRRRAGA